MWQKPNSLQSGGKVSCMILHSQALDAAADDYMYNINIECRDVHKGVNNSMRLASSKLQNYDSNNAKSI